jgi:CHAT domain-containing protein
MILRKLYVSLLIGWSMFAICSGQDSAISARYLFSEQLQAREAGDFKRSVELLEQLLEGNYNLEDYNLALIHNALGSVYYETGRLDASFEQYRIAEGLLSATDPGTLQLRVSIYINQANYYKALGEYSNSLQYNNEAQRLLEQDSTWDEISFDKLSAILLNKGITLFRLGRYEEARGILIECGRIKEDHQHPYLGSVYFNLARVCLHTGDSILAQQYYIKSIARWSSEYDPDYYELANIYLHYGQFLSARGQNEKGFEYLQKALRNYTQNYGTLHPLTAACYESLARYSLDQAEPESALDYIQLALHSVSPGFDGSDYFSNPGIEASGDDLTLLRILSTKTEALQGMAGIAGTAGQQLSFLESAVATSLLSIDLLQRIRNSYLSSESRIYLYSNQKDLFTTGIELNLELFRISGEEVYKEQAFLMASSGKSNELIYQLNQKEWLYLESLADTAAVSVTELRLQMDHLSNLIQIQSMQLNPDSAYLNSLKDRLFHARDSFNRKMEELHTAFPFMDHFESAGTHFSLEQIRRNLNRNETLLEYYMSGTGSTGGEQLYIFVVSKNRCNFYRSQLDSEFHQNMETVMLQLQGFDPYRETNERFDSLKAALYGIYLETVQPVERWLDGRDLVVVPDESLSYIPFDALITSLEKDTITNYAGIPYLLRDYRISYMYNSQLIRRHSPRMWRFPEVTAWIPESGIGRLKGAEEEVEDILKVVPGIAIRKSVAKPELAVLLEKPTVLHLAMHSLASDQGGQSPYFILDTVADPLQANRMHDYEINALHLSTPMVVLSSCETAGGQLQTGEGVMSLSRSFLEAGAASVVHSLWPVEDVKSRELMVGFYRELKRGFSKRKALSIAKQEYLDNQPPFYTHPYYWAAFQITGDPSPLCYRPAVPLITGSVLVALLVFYFLKRRIRLRRSRASFT